MGQDDRPEDEQRPDATEGLTPGPAEEPAAEGATQERLGDLEPDDGAPEAEPKAEPDGAPEAAPEAESTPAPTPEEAHPDDEDDGRRRSFFGRTLLVAAPIVLVALLLVGWHRVASSDAFCSTCHEMVQPANASDRSIHEDVSCLACHTRSGLLGSLMYLPTFVRETLHKFTPLDIADGVLSAQDCDACHEGIASTPELAAAHETDATCDSCHGDVSHPPFRLAGFERPVEAIQGEDPHPAFYVQSHGEDVVSGAATCVECHSTKFCEACHFRSVYPHPQGWIQDHGPTQMEQGADSCTLCHPTTFCAGCHGTEIPHQANWLDEHWRDLQDAPVSPCLLCHPKADCTTCHAQHGVHREQGLYVGEAS